MTDCPDSEPKALPENTIGNFQLKAIPFSFPNGFAIDYRGQMYRPLCCRPYLKRDGTEVVLVDWQTDCPECGDGFVCSTTAVFRAPNRRCIACRKRGRKVTYKT